jgi:hypothetical protein
LQEQVDLFICAKQAGRQSFPDDGRPQMVGAFKDEFRADSTQDLPAAK